MVSPDVLRVADPNVPPCSTKFNQSLTRRDGGGRSWLVLCRFAVGRIAPLELVNSVAGGDVHFVVPPPAPAGGGSVRCGRQAPPGRPHRVRQRGLLYCRTAAQPWGEAFAVAGRRDAAVVWAEGLHSGWNARMIGRGSCRGRQTLRSVPLMKFFLFAIHAPLLGGSTGASFCRCCGIPMPALPDRLGVREWWWKREKSR